MNHKLLLINGPNLNLLGTREPQIYGAKSLEEIVDEVREFCRTKGIEVLPFQSNHEGSLIDFIQQQGPGASFGILNAGALTHTSIALRDALKGVGLKFIEVHISNVHAREEFRHHSYLSEIASGLIVGLGTGGYLLAARHWAQQLEG